MDSYGLPIGDRGTVNRRGVDPDSRICLRSCMETVEGWFVQAPQINLRLQTKCPLLALSRHALLHCMSPLSGAKRTCPFRGSPLLRSLLGIKRTSLFAAQM